MRGPLGLTGGGPLGRLRLIRLKTGQLEGHLPTGRTIRSSLNA